MALSAQDKQEMAELIAATLGRQSVAAQDAAHAKAAPKRAAQDTARKASAIVRQLDPVSVDVGTLEFRVVAANSEGRVFTNGARVTVFEEGKIHRSLNGAMIAALSQPDVLTQLQAAIATVDKRARLGAHKPTTAEREAAAVKS